jgi:hypothetical protein
VETRRPVSLNKVPFHETEENKIEPFAKIITDCGLFPGSARSINALILQKKSLYSTDPHAEAPTNSTLSIYGHKVFHGRCR